MTIHKVPTSFPETYLRKRSTGRRSYSKTKQKAESKSVRENTIIKLFTIQCKSKSKTVPLRHAGEKGERKYSSYSFFTSALEGVSGQRHAPAAL
jgi:hypothetical protein